MEDIQTMEKISLNGVEVFPFTSEAQLMDYADTHKGILVAINAEKILHATDATRSIINRNMGYCDGAGAMMALKNDEYGRYTKNRTEKRRYLVSVCGL